MSKLETDVMIGMNCVSLQSLRDNIPVYSCSLCKVDFHHNDRNHMLGKPLLSRGGGGGGDMMIFECPKKYSELLIFKNLSDE